MDTLILFIVWALTFHHDQCYFEPCTKDLFAVTINREAINEDNEIFILSDNSTPVFVLGETEQLFTETTIRNDKEVPNT